MKNLSKKIILGAAALLISIPALAMPVSVGVEAAFASRYIWRGFDVYGNYGAVQPSLTVGVAPTEALSVSGNVWGSYNVDDTEKLDEVDYTLDCSYSFSDDLSLSAGIIHYVFPEAEGDDNTSEAYASVGFALPFDLSGSAGLYYDFDDGEGMYLNFGIEYGIAMKEGVDLTLGASAGYMDYDEEGMYAGLDGFSDFNFSVGVSSDLGHGFGLSASANQMISGDDEINTDDEFWTSCAISYEF